MSEPTRESDLAEAIFCQLGERQQESLRQALMTLRQQGEVTPYAIRDYLRKTDTLDEIQSLIERAYTGTMSIPHLAGLPRNRMPNVVLKTKYSEGDKCYEIVTVYFLDTSALRSIEIGVVGLILMWMSGLHQDEPEKGAVATKMIEVPADQARILKQISYVFANPGARNEAIFRKVRSLFQEVQRYAKFKASRMS